MARSGLGRAGFRPIRGTEGATKVRSILLGATLVILQVLSMSTSSADQNAKKPGTFEMLRWGYARDASAGYYWNCQSMPEAKLSQCWVAIPGCDGSTLETFEASRRHARDSATAYFYGAKLEGSDSASFQALNDNYAKDKTGGYHFGDRVVGSDGPTFEALNALYAQDRTSTYCRGKRMDEADRASFKALGKGAFAKDARHVYAWDGNTDTVAIISADPQTFEPLEDSDYGRDSRHAFYSQSVLAEEPKSLELVFPDKRNPWYRADYARDRSGVYWLGRKVLGADSATFRLFDTNFAADKASVFLRGKLVEGVDRPSFRLLEPEIKVGNFYACAEDNSHWYSVSSSGVEKRRKPRKSK